MSDNKEQTMMFGFCEALLDEGPSAQYDSDEQVYHIATRSGDSDTEDESDEDVNTKPPESEKEEELYTGKDGTTIWYPNPIQAKITPRVNGLIQHGPTPHAKTAKTELECWNLFFSNDLIGEILRNTNAEINSKTFPENHNTRLHIVKETTMDELLAMFGLMYIAGLNHSTGYNLTDLWRSDGTGVDIFRMTMSLQRFNFLQGCLRFDNASTRAARICIDNMALVRSMFDKFVENCHKAYIPGQFLTFDEKYISFRGDCALRQFLPNTQAAYGIKLYALVDVKAYYTVNLEIHAGNQPDGPYVTSYDPIDVVDRLVKPVTKTNRNITFNIRDTSVSLVKHLLNEHRLTSIGVLKKNKNEIPQSFISTQGRSVNSSRFGFQKDLTLLSYMQKKTKTQLLLSSYHNLDLKNRDKSEMIAFYNSTKIGVEFVEKLYKSHDVRNYSKSWPILILYHIMNIAAVNSFIIYSENNKNTKVRRCEFIRKLGLALLGEHLKIRKNKNNLPRELRKRIFEQMGESLNDPPTSESNPYKRCRECPSSKDRKTKYCCIECKKPLCLQHVITMCQNCTSLEID